MNAVPPTTGRQLPSKEEILAFQDRWLRRAGLAAVAGALIIAASIGLQRVGLHLPNGNSDADQLVFAHAHSSRLIYSSILQGIGFALFALPLAVLFRSAASRTQRIRNAFFALVLLGPLAFGVGLVVSAAGSSQAASDFVKQEPAVVQSARQHAAQAQASSAKPTAKPAKRRPPLNRPPRRRAPPRGRQRPGPGRPPPGRPRPPLPRRPRIRPPTTPARASPTISTSTRPCS